MNFQAALRALSIELQTPTTRHEDPWPTNRPVKVQPQVETDGLDPAAPGGPAPINGAEPAGQPVVSDPLLESPIVPGQPIPHVEGPDEDQTVLTGWN